MNTFLCMYALCLLSCSGADGSIEHLAIANRAGSWQLGAFHTAPEFADATPNDKLRLGGCLQPRTVKACRPCRQHACSRFVRPSSRLTVCVLVPDAFCSPLQVSSLGPAALAGFTAAGGATLMLRSRWAAKARAGVCGQHRGGCPANRWLLWQLPLCRAHRHTTHG